MTTNYELTGPLVSREFIADQGSTLGPNRRTLKTLYGLFLELTRQLYSSQDNLLINTKTLWDADPVKTKIWIDTEYVWEDKTPELRPAIYISIKGLKPQSLVSPKSAIGTNTKEGETHYGKTISGGVSFVHIGQTKGQTVDLIDNTYSFIDGLADVIRRDFCFETFNIVDITPLKVVKEEKDHLRGEIIAAFTYNDYWSVKLESPKLKKIVLSSRQAVSSLI